MNALLDRLSDWLDEDGQVFPHFLIFFAACMLVFLAIILAVTLPFV